jgi:hypothetical protein
LVVVLVDWWASFRRRPPKEAIVAVVSKVDMLAVDGVKCLGVVDGRERDSVVPIEIIYSLIASTADGYICRMEGLLSNG